MGGMMIGQMISKKLGGAVDSISKQRSVTQKTDDDSKKKGTKDSGGGGMMPSMGSKSDGGGGMPDAGGVAAPASAHKGARVRKSGWMNVKKGEVVLTKSQAKRAGKRMRGKRTSGK